MEILKGSKVLLTGRTGFLGRYLEKALIKAGCEVVSDSMGGEHHHYDLRIPLHTQLLFRDCPDFVVHAAGYNQNVTGSALCPFKIFRDNTLMTLNVLEEASRRNIQKVLILMASCAMPHDRDILKGTDIMSGPPHVTVESHGYAKRNAQLACRFYRQEHHLKAVTVCPPTLYGPGEPINEHKTKVVGSMVARFVRARRHCQPDVTCWGSGNPLRHLLYVEDAANLIVRALRVWEGTDIPLLIGSHDEPSIRELAVQTANLVGYNGVIHWDTAMPDGAYRKRLDLSLMEKVLGTNLEFTSLENGLKNTIAYVEGVLD